MTATPGVRVLHQTQSTGQWDYLEVAVDLKKKTWRASNGRAEKLRQGSTAPLLVDLGMEGWELAGTVPLARAAGAYRLYFKRPHTD